MKSNTNDLKPSTRYLIMFIFGVLFGICALLTPCTAQETKEKEWKEVKEVTLPQGLEVFSGITESGNPKYWFVIQGIKVFISPTNKEHYINNTATIVLVEWYNQSKDRYKYTTRQAKTKKNTKINIDIL